MSPPRADFWRTDGMIEVRTSESGFFWPPNSIFGCEKLLWFHTSNRPQEMFAGTESNEFVHSEESLKRKDRYKIDTFDAFHITMYAYRSPRPSRHCSCASEKCQTMGHPTITTIHRWSSSIMLAKTHCSARFGYIGAVYYGAAQCSRVRMSGHIIPIGSLHLWPCHSHTFLRLPSVACKLCVSNGGFHLMRSFSLRIYSFSQINAIDQSSLLTRVLCVVRSSRDNRHGCSQHDDFPCAFNVYVPHPSTARGHLKLGTIWSAEASRNGHTRARRIAN